MEKEGRRFVVTPFTLLEMKIEIDFDAVELGEPAFGEAPEGFDAVDVGSALGEGFFLVDAHVLVIADIDQAVVSRPAVGADDALRVDPAANDGPQGVLGAIRHDFGVDFPLPLEDAEDRLLERSPAPQAWQGASPDPAGTKVALIDFHHSSERPAPVHPLQGNQQPEALIKGVHGLPIQLQKRSGLRRCKIQTKAFHYFFDPILA